MYLLLLLFVSYLVSDLYYCKLKILRDEEVIAFLIRSFYILCRFIDDCLI